MKQLTALVLAIGFVSLFQFQTIAEEHSALARVTVYWRGTASGAGAAWNGAWLSEGHCAVDPKKISYGSKVVFHDAECVAVDTGPAVVDRKAARFCGRSAAERKAIVIDRFFDSKQRALAWAKSNPDFMVVRVRTPKTEGAD
jgi:3D (Asp-Asp-Asp) domain-containing protein